MSKVDCRAVLRLDKQGLSRRKIALSLGCARDSVARILNRAEKVGFIWSEGQMLTSKEAERRLFPERSCRGEQADRLDFGIFEPVWKPFNYDLAPQHLLWLIGTGGQLLGRQGIHVA